MSAIFMAFSVPQYLRVSVLLDMGEAMEVVLVQIQVRLVLGMSPFVCDGRVTGECKSNEVYPGQQAQVQMG